MTIDWRKRKPVTLRVGSKVEAIRWGGSPQIILPDGSLPPPVGEGRGSIAAPHMVFGSDSDTGLSFWGDDIIFIANGIRCDPSAWHHHVTSRGLLRRDEALAVVESFTVVMKHRHSAPRAFEYEYPHSDRSRLLSPGGERAREDLRASFAEVGSDSDRVHEWRTPLEVKEAFEDIIVLEAALTLPDLDK